MPTLTLHRATPLTTMEIGRLPVGALPLPGEGDRVALVRVRDLEVVSLVRLAFALGQAAPGATLEFVTETGQTATSLPPATEAAPVAALTPSPPARDPDPPEAPEATPAVQAPPTTGAQVPPPPPRAVAPEPPPMAPTPDPAPAAEVPPAAPTPPPPAALTEPPLLPPTETTETTQPMVAPPANAEPSAPTAEADTPADPWTLWDDGDSAAAEAAFTTHTLDSDGRARVRAMLQSPATDQIVYGCRIARLTGWRSTTMALRRLLSHEDASVREAAVRAVGALAGPALIRSVRVLVQDNNSQVRAAAMSALLSLENH